MSNRDCALQLASVGLAIFPCDHTKAPLPGLRWRFASTTDSHTIQRWWEESPEAIPAIDLGKSNLIVIDLDKRGDGVDGEYAFRELAAAHGDYLVGMPVVATANHGFHLYYRQPNNRSLGNRTGSFAGRGIDVRGNGGYVIAPGAQLVDGRAWRRVYQTPELAHAFSQGQIPALPEWVVERIVGPEQRQVQLTIDRDRLAAARNAWMSAPPEHARQYALAALNAEAANVLKAGIGSRNNTLNDAAFSLGTLIEHYAIGREEIEGALSNAAAIVGLEAREINATLRSALNAGSAAPRPALLGTDSALSHQEGMGISATPPYFARWHYFGDGSNRPLKWLIKYLLFETGVAFVSGQWGAYKTTVVLDICISVMTSVRFAGRYLVKRPGSVLFFALEGAAMLETRLRTMARARGCDLALPFAWANDAPNLLAPDAADQYCAAVAAAAVKHPISLIVIDTMVAAAGYTGEGQENDNALAQRIAGVLAEVSRRTGALVLVVDHFGKNVEAGTRGASAKEARADVVLAILVDKELNGSVKNPRLAVRKVRDGVQGFEIPFRPRVVELGRDEDGDPITGVELDWLAVGADFAEAKALFLSLLDRFTQQGRHVNIKPGNNYAPSTFAKEPESVRSGVRKEALKAAMLELLEDNALKVEQRGKPSKQVSVLVRSSLGPNLLTA